MNRYDEAEAEQDRCRLLRGIYHALLIEAVLLAGVAAGMLLVGTWGRW
jgi:hypothetical protein